MVIGKLTLVYFSPAVRGSPLIKDVFTGPNELFYETAGPGTSIFDVFFFWKSAGSEWSARGVISGRVSAGGG